MRSQCWDVWLLSKYRITAERLYLVALIIFMTSSILATTMFPIPGKLYTLSKLMALFLIGCKIAWYDRYTIKQFITVGSLIGIALLVKVVSGYMDPLWWTIFLIGAKEVSFEKILKIYVILAGGIVALAVVASLFGVIVNLRYDVGDRGIRNSFGIVYPTDFAAHIFYLMITIFYLNRKRVSATCYLIAIGITGLVYYFCNTRLDVACMVLAIAGYLWLDRRKDESYRIKAVYSVQEKKSGYISYAMPATAVLMTIVSWLYDEKQEWMTVINSLISDRLRLGHQGLVEYGLRFFGQFIKMIGNGSTTKITTKYYFFIDCSYLYIGLQYGLVFLLVVLTVYVFCCRKYQNDMYFLLTIVLISINCMIAHHLLEIAYNPFAMALFAKMTKEECQSS